jgi:hypothetical protein
VKSNKMSVKMIPNCMTNTLQLSFFMKLRRTFRYFYVAFGTCTLLRAVLTLMMLFFNFKE